MSEFKEALKNVEADIDYFRGDNTEQSIDYEFGNLTITKGDLHTIKRALQIADKVVLLPRDAEPQVGDVLMVDANYWDTARGRNDWGIMLRPAEVFEMGQASDSWLSIGTPGISYQTIKPSRGDKFVRALWDRIIQRDNKPVIYLEELNDAI